MPVSTIMVCVPPKQKEKKVIFLSQVKIAYKIKFLHFRFSMNSVITVLYAEIQRVKVMIYLRYFLYLDLVASILVKSWSVT